MKVYGWYGHWRDERNPDRHGQARFVMAAKSMAEIKRITGVRTLWNISETGNDRELEVTSSASGILFASPNNCRFENYYEVNPKDPGVRP